MNRSCKRKIPAKRKDRAPFTSWIYYLAFWVLVFPLLTACVAQGMMTPSLPSATAINEHKGAKGWHIQFSMSGGFAGLQRSVELSSTGQMTVNDQKMNRQVSVQVPPTELEEISSWVLQAQPTQSQPRLSSCRDCFEYEVTIRRGEEVLYYWFDDVTLEDADLAPLVNTLARLQEQALSGQLTP